MDDRREDWRNGVDKKLVDLTSAQRSTDDELDELDLKYNSLDHIIRGDPENDISGFHERLHNVENGLQDLRAENVKVKVADTVVQGFKWQFWGLVLTAAITALSAVFSWDRIRTYLDKKDTDPVDRMIDRAAHPKARHRHVVIRQPPETPTED